MRLPLLLVLCFAVSAANAGIQDTCAPKKNRAEAYKSCIEAERRRAANELRDMNDLAFKGISDHIKKTGEKKVLQDFRNSQANHVRRRKLSCGKEPQGIRRDICEGNMDFVQIQRLKKYVN